MPGDSLLDHGLWSASPKGFTAQLSRLQKDVDIVGLRELPAALNTARGRYAVITFDDGYRDNHDVALPILQAARVPATFFVSTGFIDRPRLAWWDEVAWICRTSQRQVIALSFAELPLRHAIEGTIARILQRIKARPWDEMPTFLDRLADAADTGRAPNSAADGMWMTWDMIRRLEAAGMEIGGHTVEHPVLSRLPRADQRWELAESYRRLCVELGHPPAAMSYPVGGPAAFTDETMALCRELGWQLACSYYGGSVQGGIKSLWNIPRMAVEPDVGPAVLCAAMAMPRWFT